MWRWFDLRLDQPKSKLLKMAVGAMDQVAFTDRELAGRPQKASLCLTPENAVLVSRTEAADAFFVLRIPERLMSSFECYESCNLQSHLHTLHRHLKQLEDKTEFAEIALYCEDPTESANAVINFELNEDGIINSSKIPLLSWHRAEIDLWYIAYDYPVRLGLSSQSFCDLITIMDSFGCTVHATLFENKVHFRVVNYELDIPTEPEICETESDRGFPCALKFDIQHKSALLNAATLSGEMIWIRFLDSFTLVSFQIDGLGDIFFGRYNHVGPMS